MSNETVSDIDRELIRRRALGWGAAFDLIDPEHSLARDVRFTGGDLALVDQIDNLAQDLSVALTTRLGDDVFHRDFGFDGLNAMVEQTEPLLVREGVRFSVLRVLKRESRVRRIITVSLDGDTPLQPPPPGSRELNVRVEFEAVSGDQLAIDLGSLSNVV